MAINNEGLYYTTIEKFIKWISANFAGVLANDSTNQFTTSSDDTRENIKEALLNAEARVDGFLKRRGYLTPVDSVFIRTHSFLRMFVYNIATFELFGRKGVTKERYYKYLRTIQDLKDISEGEQQLPDCTVPFRSPSKITHGNALPSAFAETKRKYANSI